MTEVRLAALVAQARAAGHILNVSPATGLRTWGVDEFDSLDHAHIGTKVRDKEGDVWTLILKDGERLWQFNRGTMLRPSITLLRTWGPVTEVLE